MAPNQVRKQDDPRLLVKINDDSDTLLKPKITKGSMVRLNKSKGVFDKGYLPNWGKEHFQVKNVPEAKREAKRPVYKLEDNSGEEVIGSWYLEELQKITNDQYRIEKVLRRRTTSNGRKEKLVRWDGWPDKFNSWIDESDEYDVAG